MNRTRREALLAVLGALIAGAVLYAAPARPDPATVGNTDCLWLGKALGWYPPAPACPIVLR